MAALSQRPGRLALEVDHAEAAVGTRKQLSEVIVAMDAADAGLAGRQPERVREAGSHGGRQLDEPCVGISVHGGHRLGQLALGRCAPGGRLGHGRRTRGERRMLRP